MCLTGPTASGKSAVALCLAERLSGEIISADSMQVYRGLDLGTAKPAPADRARIPHHLLDVVGLEVAFNAARWVDLARAALDDIHRRDRIAIVCGGTGLYFRALLEGLDSMPPSAPQVRADLENTPLPELLAELAERDPAEFATIDRANRRRVVRALEVIRLTGRPLSDQKTRGRNAAPGQRPAVFVLRREPADLRERIERRVDRMFADGLVEETRRLLDRGLAENRTALQALGYRQVVEHLRGQRDLTETVALVKQKTWQFARRQMTWWRSWPALWMDVAADEPAEVTAAAIEQIWRRALGQ
ncbi:MAG: tRNA (adenosine(37)-N6)-dimethylallyltransferase MiaA [Verrucomicrobia bacterium]|nr:tRNA (adenosine(37)-N6)-dimethylallyltransferase MiaA [Verrucomicrobiota bacterium]